MDADTLITMVRNTSEVDDEDVELAYRQYLFLPTETSRILAELLDYRPELAANLTIQPTALDLEDEQDEVVSGQLDEVAFGMMVDEIVAQIHRADPMAVQLSLGLALDGADGTRAHIKGCSTCKLQLHEIVRKLGQLANE